MTAPAPLMTKAEAHARLTAPGAPFEMEEVVIRGVATRTWKHQPRTLREVFLASQTFGDRDFVVLDGERASFAAFGKATLALAAELSARGVRKGDRVAVLMRNLPEWPVAFYAAALTGAIVTPLNAWWTGPELEFAMRDSGAKVLIADAQRWDRLAGRANDLPDLERVYVSRSEIEPREKAHRLEDIIGPVNDWAGLSDHPMPQIALEPEDAASIFYTSGTTGKPKGALASHRSVNCNLLSGPFGQARMMLMAGMALPDPDPHKSPQRVFLVTVPFFHVTGCWAILNPAMTSGHKLVLMRRWDADEAMRLIETEKVSITGGVPTIAWQLITHRDRAKYDLSSLELISYGGAPSAPDLVRKVASDLKSVAGNGWGMTETSAVFSQHFGPEYTARPDSCGPAAAVGDMKIMDADGARELPVGEVGELWVKGPQVVEGYWNNPQATAETFHEGWMRTGDLARLDDEGYCFMVDRAKDMLIRGGENIYCIEVENVLFEHPAVVDAALIGLACPIYGEQPAAVVTLRPGETVAAAELQAFVRQRLAGFKVPTRIVFLTEPLPRNATGKIMKGELGALFNETA